MLHAQKIPTHFNSFQLANRVMLAAALLVCLFTASSGMAQAPFVDVSNEMDIWTDHTSGYLGAGLSMADFNGDGLDDLSIAHHMGNLQFYLGDGAGFVPYELDLPDYPNEASASCGQTLTTMGTRFAHHVPISGQSALPQRR